jgi:hypothetical protein
MRARLEHNPREHDGLAWLSLGRSRERYPELDLEIVTGAFQVLEGAVFRQIFPVFLAMQR